MTHSFVGLTSVFTPGLADDQLGGSVGLLACGQQGSLLASPGYFGAWKT